MGDVTGDLVPCVCNGALSLALCCPEVRKTAKINDVVVLLATEKLKGGVGTKSYFCAWFQVTHTQKQNAYHHVCMK
jgi:hypothetical protein